VGVIIDTIFEVSDLCIDIGSLLHSRRAVDAILLIVIVVNVDVSK
jgi:hypothetical protein